MGARHFDHLARTLGTAGSRRGLLGLLATLPVLGGLVALLDVEEPGASGRRKQRQERRTRSGHRQRLDAEKNKSKKCKPKPKTKTCAGKCGIVKNNCKKKVNCGSCDCKTECPDCFICQDQGPTTPAVCVVDPAKVGDPCGSDGQVCQPDGACACQAGSCPDNAPICDAGACVPCTTDTQCESGGLGDLCCSGRCQECCGDGDCSGATPACNEGTCVCGDVCAEGCQFSVLQDAIDALPTGATIRLCAETYLGGALLGDNQKVLSLRGVGEGEDGTIVDGQNNEFNNAVQVFNGTTAHFHDLRFTGATETGFFIAGGTATLTNCTITGNVNNFVGGDGGGGVVNRGDLTLTNCTVNFNSTTGSGGGISNSPSGTATLNDTVVTENDSDLEGGGIYNANSGTVNLNGTSSVADNDPDNCRGFGTYNGGERCEA
jgi:hypothetical protein